MSSEPTCRSTTSQESILRRCGSRQIIGKRSFADRLGRAGRSCSRVMEKPGQEGSSFSATRRRGASSTSKQQMVNSGPRVESQLFHPVNDCSWSTFPCAFRGTDSIAPRDTSGCVAGGSRGCRVRNARGFHSTQPLWPSRRMPEHPPRPRIRELSLRHHRSSVYEHPIDSHRILMRLSERPLVRDRRRIEHRDVREAPDA